MGHDHRRSSAVLRTANLTAAAIINELPDPDYTDLIIRDIRAIRG
jgi:hypothetical protein